MDFQFSRHAEEAMLRRRISYASVEAVLTNPGQRLLQEPGKEVFQALVEFENAKMYLLRVVVATDRTPPLVVTVFRTTRIEKYWRRE